MVIRSMFAVGMMLLGNAVAQQPAAPKSQPAAPAKTAPAKTQAAPAAKLPEAPAAKAFSTPKEKVSYAIGMNIGSGMRNQKVDIDPDVFARGVKDALAGKTLMTEEEMKATLTQFTTEMQAKAAEERKVALEKNKKDGEAFLAANKGKEGVVTTATGLQYKILSPGTGAKPTAGDTVVCNYRGAFIDGNEFDSSYKRGQPASFPVTGVIKGWTEALQMMPTGSKWQLFIPSDLAYGESGRGPIPPNSTLVFEVELVSIKQPEPAKTLEPQTPAAAPSPTPKP